jgi:hypothetical protein
LRIKYINGYIVIWLYCFEFCCNSVLTIGIFCLIVIIQINVIINKYRDMKFIVFNKDLDRAPEMWLREAGYRYHQGHGSNADSFIRPLGSTPYPQYHIYFIAENERVIFNLHLDQKKPSYPGSHAHSGEYEGAVVEEEIKRLKSLIKM